MNNPCIDSGHNFRIVGFFEGIRCTKCWERPPEKKYKLYEKRPV